MTAISCNSFTNAMVQLKRGLTVLPEVNRKSVTILGAGPAGLIRAIQSVLAGHHTTIVEKRADNAPGRCNTVALKTKTIDLLKEYGVYQSLVEQGKVYRPNSFGNTSVRISDLEQALKRVLAELSTHNAVTFRYNALVANIDVDAITQKAQLSLSTHEVLEPADIIVNAEGAHSITNIILDNPRIEALPKVPVIAAIFEDDRPKISSVSSFFTYAAKTIKRIALSIYYYGIYFFRFIFMNERFTSDRRTIVGSLILKTPGQNYVGCGFTAKRSNELLALQKTVHEKRSAVQEAEKNGVSTEVLLKELKKAEKAYQSFVKYWTYLSFCAANVFTTLARIISYVFNAQTSINFDTASLLPIKEYSITEIGADRATYSFQLIGKSFVLIAGDALATVDPATGLGCNTALQTSKLFKNVLDKLKENELPLEQILMDYHTASQYKVDFIHQESQRVRQVYRPDAAQLV